MLSFNYLEVSQTSSGPPVLEVRAPCSGGDGVQSLPAPCCERVHSLSGLLSKIEVVSVRP